MKGATMNEDDALRSALDDLWGCIGKREIKHLRPETVRVAQENQERLWHRDIVRCDGCVGEHSPSRDGCEMSPADG